MFRESYTASVSKYFLSTSKAKRFAAKQANLEDVAAEKLKQLEEEHKNIQESNKLLAADIKIASTGTMSVLFPSFAQLWPHI